MYYFQFDKVSHIVLLLSLSSSLCCYYTLVSVKYTPVKKKKADDEDDSQQQKQIHGSCGRDEGIRGIKLTNEGRKNQLTNQLIFS